MNKKVKEIIQKIEDVRDNPAILDDDGWCDNWMVMSAKECNILLDYLNQLEEENKELQENYKAILKQRDDITKNATETIEKYQQENKQLEINRDEAIEILKLCDSQCSRETISILERGKE